MHAEVSSQLFLDQDVLNVFAEEDLLLLIDKHFSACVLCFPLTSASADSDLFLCHTLTTQMMQKLKLLHNIPILCL